MVESVESLNMEAAKSIAPINEPHRGSETEGVLNAPFSQQDEPKNESPNVRLDFDTPETTPEMQLRRCSDEEPLPDLVSDEDGEVSNGHPGLEVHWHSRNGQRYYLLGPRQAPLHPPPQSTASSSSPEDQLNMLIKTVELHRAESSPRRPRS